jgi:hypothetical protein
MGKINAKCVEIRGECAEEYRCNRFIAEGVKSISFRRWGDMVIGPIYRPLLNSVVKLLK